MNSKNSLIIGGIIIVLTVLTIGGFLFVKTKQVPKEAAQTEIHYNWRAKDETGKWVYGDKFAHKFYDDPHTRPGKCLITKRGEVLIDRYTMSPLVEIYNEKPLYFGDIVKVTNVPWMYNEGVTYYAVVGKYNYKTELQTNYEKNILKTIMQMVDLFNNQITTLWNQEQQYGSREEITQALIENQPSASMIVFANSYEGSGRSETSRLDGKSVYTFGSQDFDQNCGGDGIQNGCTSDIPGGATVEIVGNVWDNEDLLKKLSGGNTQSDFTSDICEYDRDSAGE
jgi:hypothetical protein